MLSQVQERGCGAGSVATALRVQVAEPRSSAVIERDSAAELELMRGVAERRPEAEAALVERVIGLVRSRARLLTNAAADADDAAQASMLEILRSAKSFRGEGSIEAWCDRITIRTTLRLQRRQARRLALIDDQADPDRVDTSQRTRKLAEEIPGHVSSFLAELSQERREVMALRAQGYGVEEIAAQIGVSPNTVKDRLRTARKQLRQWIRQREAIASIRRGGA